MLSIRYSDQYNLTTENYYTENETVLLPGGPGYTHRTGKDEGYCLQYPNGTKFVDRKTGLEYCEDGHSLEITERTPWRISSCERTVKTSRSETRKQWDKDSSLLRQSGDMKPKGCDTSSLWGRL